jgi:hypothetical protein
MFIFDKITDLLINIFVLFSFNYTVSSSELIKRCMRCVWITMNCNGLLLVEALVYNQKMRDFDTYSTSFSRITDFLLLATP